MTTKTGTAAAESGQRTKAKTDDIPQESASKTVQGDTPAPPEPTLETDGRAARTYQHPSLTTAENAVGVEVAERTVDLDTASGEGEQATTQHIKDFVTTQREWDSEDHDAVHERNFRAVRQYMVSQGLRPDAKVVFMGETVGDPVRFRKDLASVTLRYGVEAVPAVLADGMEQVHTVIDQNGPSAVELAEYQAKREDRIRAARAASVGV